ncbi:MAG: alpha-galactosidase [Clostridia bacterium]|nr:alpha-galactosidase [Clostridia bacterium]
MAKRIFYTRTDIPGVKTHVETLQEGEISLYRVTIAFPEGVETEPVTLWWEEDMINHLSVWTPMAWSHHLMHQWFAPTRADSCFSRGAPLLTTLGEGGKNRFTVSVSDPVTPMTMQFCIKDLDQQNKVEYAVCFFSQPWDKVTTYTADIRVDARPIPWYEAVPQATAWWKEYGYTIPSCPPAAEDATYSSWYNFHQAPHGEKLLADLEIASELGFKTVILDDGWQFEGPSSGNYSQCGAWQVAKDKFDDFKSFVDGVHKLGMKLMVWFTVPFVGNQDPMYPVFKGKYLYEYEDDLMAAAVLDPRYPDVREYLVNTYKNFLLKFDIDGFKLDFIDSFRAGNQTAPFGPGMDRETVDAGVQALLEEITGNLAAVKPDLLYEYRQNYVGPAINRFGNMLRVADCAYEALANRIGVADLRLLHYPVAVHSDMLFWAPEESIDLCARQILNILFGVPQISVILQDSTEEQKALLQNYLVYWTENRELILHGSFRALHPELNYTLLGVEDENREIVVLYADQPYTFRGKKLDLFHNGEEDGLIFENPTDKTLRTVMFDCFGTSLGEVEVPAGAILRIPLPRTGMLRVTSDK